jgi:hypothetical protein
MDWEGESLNIESAQQADGGMLLRVLRKKKGLLPLRLVLTMETIWDHNGNCQKTGPATLTSDRWIAESPGKPVMDPCLPALGPSIVVDAGDTTWFRIRKNEPKARIPGFGLLEEQEKKYNARFDMKSDTGLARFAIQTCMAWNTVYDPVGKRCLHTVNRIWNVHRGGYVLFCWDNLMGSLLSLYGLGDTSLAFSNFRAVLQDACPEGFPSNNSQGNGRKAFDRSQPPVGGIVALELFKKTGSRDFVRSVFPALLTWNRWWLKRRMNGSRLSWGSHEAINPFADPSCHRLLGAKLESGLDDSPMYDSVAFDSTRGLMQLHDVGLNALFLADCEALLELAPFAGKPGLEAISALKSSVSYFTQALQGLFSEKDGLYLNHYLPSSIPSRLYSPTLLYPMLTSAPKRGQVQNCIDSLLRPFSRLGGEPGLPSISRSHPDFGKQRYWKGSVWPPLNFLVYMGLRKQKQYSEARKLANHSFQLFINEYKRAKVICENYSGRNGRCDDPLVNSEPYYFWGGLLAWVKDDSFSLPQK